MPTLSEIYNLLPAAKLIDKKTINNQTTADIIQQVLTQHELNKNDARKIAHLFDYGNVYATSQAIWDFLKYKVPYKVEPSSFQSTKTLSRFIYDAKNNTGKNDCKHFSNFTGAILDALGYSFKYRFAGYSSYSKNPTHVYVVAYDDSNNEILIDAVINGFDLEKPFKIKIDKKPSNKKNMSLYSLSGIDENEEIGNIFKKAKGVVKKAGAAVKKGAQAVTKPIATAAKAVAKPIAAAAKTIKQGALTVGLAVPRNAFLLLIRFNVHGWATGLNKMSWERLKWWKDIFGGNRTDLQNAIKAGAKNKRILGLKDNDFLVPESVGAIGVEPVTVTSALATATPIIVKVTNLLKEAEKISDSALKIKTSVDKTTDAVKKGNEAFKALTGKNVSDVLFKKEEGKSSDTSQLTKNDFTTPTDAEALKVAAAIVKQPAKPINKTLLIGGGIAALAAVYFMTKKR
jgi:hypothetical protein